MYNIKGKGHPKTWICRHRREVEVQLQPIRNLGTRSRWVVYIEYYSEAVNKILFSLLEYSKM
jgi:hypothetical protein